MEVKNIEFPSNNLFLIVCRHFDLILLKHKNQNEINLVALEGNILFYFFKPNSNGIQMWTNKEHRSWRFDWLKSILYLLQSKWNRSSSCWWIVRFADSSKTCWFVVRSSSACHNFITFYKIVDFDILIWFYFANLKLLDRLLSIFWLY